MSAVTEPNRVPHWTGCDRTVKLSELGCGEEGLAIPEWMQLHWAECHLCGSSLYGPALLGTEKLYDGDPLVCIELDCGLSHQMSCDESEYWVRDDEFLRETALLGARRLLGLPTTTLSGRCS